MFKPNRSTLKATQTASVALMVLFVAGCETGPVYQPREPGERVGYTDRQLDENRFRVTFSGNAATDREEVESYLLRRAAEVTLANGFTHFVFDDRDTVARTYYRQTFSSFDPIGGPYFGPRPWYWSTWPYYPYGVGYGYGGYGGYGGDLRPVTSYAAYAEIVTLRPGQGEGEPRAIDAQRLLERLGPLDQLETARAP